MTRPTVLLADDHQMMADALKVVLEPRYKVVATAKDGRALVEAASKFQPDVIVLDIAMPELNGLDAARLLKQNKSKAKIIFMTMHEDPYLVGEAFRAGGSGFLLKHAAAFELTDAVDKVLKGGTYVTPSAAEGQEQIQLRDPNARESKARATARQREVLQLLAEGRSTKEAADMLNITRRTVIEHKYNAMRNLGLKTNAEIVQYAVRNKLISL
jgi:DNA-binding NarL/FixJ family response regulator